MKVALITTVLDASEHVAAFLESVSWQTRPPDEIVVVDAGSTDGTLDQLRSADAITLIEEPGANIAHGRNVAISAATHDVVALTDADCVLERDWFELLLEPLETGADVAMGFYRPPAEPCSG
jgi:glycosyltransferase involved in cell wall biosynthesis